VRVARFRKRVRGASRRRGVVVRAGLLSRTLGQRRHSRLVAEVGLGLLLERKGGQVVGVLKFGVGFGLSVALVWCACVTHVGWQSVGDKRQAVVGQLCAWPAFAKG
jgi:hypothetical protein